MTNPEIKQELKSQSVTQLYNKWKDNSNFKLIDAQNMSNLNSGKVDLTFFECDVTYENNNLVKLIYKNN